MMVVIIGNMLKLSILNNRIYSVRCMRKLGSLNATFGLD